METTNLFTGAMDKHEEAKKELARLEKQVEEGVEFSPEMQDALNTAAIEVIEAENEKVWERGGVPYCRGI